MSECFTSGAWRFGPTLSSEGSSEASRIGPIDPETIGLSVLVSRILDVLLQAKG